MAIDDYARAIHPKGRFGVVFERDDETAYFYLLDLVREDGKKIISAFHAHRIEAMAPNARTRVAWSRDGDLAGLFAEGELIAVFEIAPAYEPGQLAARLPASDDRGRFLEG